MEQASQSCLPPLPSKPASLPKPCSRASHSRHRTPLQLYVWSPQTQARERTGRDPRQKQSIVCSGSPSAIGSILITMLQSVQEQRNKGPAMLCSPVKYLAFYCSPFHQALCYKCMLAFSFGDRYRFKNSLLPP